MGFRSFFLDSWGRITGPSKEKTSSGLHKFSSGRLLGISQREKAYENWLWENTKDMDHWKEKLLPIRKAA